LGVTDLDLGVAGAVVVLLLGERYAGRGHDRGAGDAGNESTPLGLHRCLLCLFIVMQNSVAKILVNGKAKFASWQGVTVE